MLNVNKKKKNIAEDYCNDREAIVVAQNCGLRR